MLTLRSIARATCDVANITMDEFFSKTRVQRIAHPRQAAFYVARISTHKSLPQIGRHYGKDHTTILHGVRKIEKSIWEHDADVDLVCSIASRAHELCAPKEKATEAANRPHPTKSENLNA